MVSATGLYAQRQQQRINFSFGDTLPGSFEGVVESLNLEGDVLFSLLDYAFWKLGFGKGLTAACCFSMYMSYRYLLHLSVLEMEWFVLCACGHRTQAGVLHVPNY